TTTWNDPLAASYRLSEVIDFSSTGWLRSVVVSANGLRSCGSRCTADATRAATATATTAAITQPRRLVIRPARITRVIFVLRRNGQSTCLARGVMGGVHVPRARAVIHPPFPGQSP